MGRHCVFGRFIPFVCRTPDMKPIEPSSIFLLIGSRLILIQRMAHLIGPMDIRQDKLGIADITHSIGFVKITIILINTIFILIH